MAIKTNFEVKGYKYYRVTKTIGHNLDGSPLKKQFVGRTKSEAEEKAKEYIELNKKGVAKLKNASFEYLFHEWLWNVKKHSNNFKSSSFDRYERVYRNDISGTKVAHCLINEITPLLLQRHYSDLYKKGTKSTKIADINKIFRVFFNYCRRQGWITINPASKELIELPGNSDTKIRLPEDEEIKIFSDFERKRIINIASSENTTLHIIILLGFCTGMREGELLGLSTQNIDIENKIIKVRKTLEKINIYDNNGIITGGRFVLTDPKSKSSVRNIPLPDFIIPILSNYVHGNDLFFETETNSYIDPRNLRRAWKRFLTRNSIPYKKFHAIRHTYASLLFRKGANLKEVQKLLGHSDLATTEKVYISVTNEDITKKVSNINEFFS